MYVAPVDEGTEEDWHLLLDQTPVATLVAPGTGGAPVVVPTHFGVLPASGGEPPVIEVHLHRANPFWAAVEADPLVLVSVVGPFVFVPHDWNPRPGTDPADGVPTSWYAAATLSCTAELIHRDADLAALLNRLAGRFEPVGLERPVDADGAPYGPLLGAIRGVRLRVDEVVVKTKFGGNRPEATRREVAARVRRRDGPGDRAAAEWAGRTLDRRGQDG
jgi:transcriptional regulator